MLKRAGRPTENESVSEIRWNIVHIGGHEAHALTKSRRSTDVWLFECGETIGVLTCFLPPGCGLSLWCLIRSNNGAAKRSKKGRQRFSPNTKAQTGATLIEKAALVEGLADKEELPMLPVQRWG